MSRSAVQTLTHTAEYVVRHPVRSVFRVVGMAKGLAAAATGRAYEEPPIRVVPRQPTPQDVADAAPTVIEPEPEPRPAAEEREPGEPGEPIVTEPTAVSRDDAHGGSQGGAQRLEDWEDELDDGIDIETPVGTTGADVAWNPDTAEADLQQPGTEPLMDPSLTKQVKHDLDQGLRDASQD